MISIAHEDARLRDHFREVLRELAHRDVAHLDRVRRVRRARLLTALAVYATRGRFPRNRDFAHTQTPYFVDASGTRCAVAALIESTGERALVERVAGTRNHAFVRELQRDLAFRAWLAEVGLTAREAARIQPSYCFITKGDVCFCERVGDPDGVIEATATGTLSASVVALYGETGKLVIGDSIPLSSAASSGDAVLVEVTFDAQAMPAYGNVFRLTGGAVEPSCGLDVPTLAKTDAIDAMLVGYEGCSAQLAQVDSTWGESQCDDDDGGCAAAGGGDGWLAVGTTLVAAAMWSRRRR